MAAITQTTDVTKTYFTCVANGVELFTHRRCKIVDGPLYFPGETYYKSHSRKDPSTLASYSLVHYIQMSPDLFHIEFLRELFESPYYCGPKITYIRVGHAWTVYKFMRAIDAPYSYTHGMIPQRPPYVKPVEGDNSCPFSIRVIRTRTRKIHRRTKKILPIDSEDWYKPIPRIDSVQPSHKCKRVFATIINLMNPQLGLLACKFIEWHKNKCQRFNCPFNKIEDLPDVKCEPEIGFGIGSYLETAVDGALSKQTDKITGVIDKLIHDAKDRITSSSIDVKSLFWSLSKNILYLCVSPTIPTAVLSLVLSLADIGIATFDMWQGILTPVTNFFNGFIGGDNKQTQSSVQPNISTDREWAMDTASIVSVVGAVIYGAFNLVQKPPESWDDIVGTCFSFGKHTMMLGVFYKLFLTDIMLVVKKIWNWCTRKSLGGDRMIAVIRDEPKILRDWAARAIYLTDPSRSATIVEDIHLSAEVVEMQAIGKTLQVYLLESDKAFNVANVISGLIGKIDALYGKIVANSNYSPYKYDPYVVWLSGDTRIGKSCAATKIISSMLENIGCSSSNPIYTRTPSNPYWNTLKNQPVVLYDDYLAVNGTNCETQIGEMFALKTCAPFNPPMADIPDKSLFYSPLIVFMISNSEYPASPLFSSPEAFYHRRNYMLSATPTSPIKTPDKYTPEELASIKHLEFKRIDPVKSGITITAKSDYDTIMIDLLADHKVYHKKEQLNLMRRQNTTRLLMNDQSCTIANSYKNFIQILKDSDDQPLSTVYKVLSKNKLVHQAGDGSAVAHIAGQKIHEYPFSIMTTCVHKEFEALSEKAQSSFVYASNPFLEDINTEGLMSTGKGDGLPFHFASMSRKIKFFAGYIPFGVCQAVGCVFRKEHMEAYAKRAVKNQGSSNLISIKTNIPKFYRSTVKALSHIDRDLDVLAGHLDQIIALDLIDPLVKDATRIKSHDGWFSNWYVPKGEKPASAWNSFVLGMCQLMDYLPAVIAGLAVAMIPIAIMGVYKKYNAPTMVYEDDTITMDYTTNMSSSGDHQTQKLQRVNRTPNRKVIAHMDDQMYGSVLKKIRRNTFFISCREGDNPIKIQARCFGLFNRTAIVLTHYMERFLAMPDVRCVLEIPSEHEKGGWATFPISFSDLKFKQVRDTGFGYLELPLKLPLFKDITSFMYPSSDVFDISRTCSLIEHRMGEETIIRKMNVNFIENQDVSSSDFTKPWRIVRGLSYPYGEKGLCGSILVSQTSTPRIVGIHTSGMTDSSMGISELLTVNDIALAKRIFHRAIPNMGDPDEARFQLNGPMVALGVDKRPVRLSDKTRILPSLIHGTFPVRTHPAPLSAYNEWYPPGSPSPLQAGCELQTLRTKSFDIRQVEQCTNSLFRELNLCVKPLRIMNDMTYLQSINGSCLEEYTSMELNSSEGYPFVKARPYTEKNKRYLFDFEDDKVVGIDPMLLNVMQDKQDLRKEGIVPVTIYMDCLKDSRIKIEKLSVVGKTRVFNIQPVDFTIQGRQMWMDFLCSYRHARYEAENSIGINVNGPEWSALYHRMNDFSPHILTGDFSSFGDILDLNIVFKVFNKIADWYDFYAPHSAFSVSRRTSIEEFLNPIHVAFDLIYLTVVGQPSGCSWTVENNSLVNCVMIRLAYVSLTNKGVSTFLQFVRLVTNGDDLIMAVKPDIIDVFNNITICEFFGRYNIKYTDVDKTGIMRSYCGILEAKYLKASFVPHPKKYRHFLAKLDIASVEDCPQWIQKVEDISEATKVNCLASLRLAYGHGPKYYKQFSDKIASALSKLDIPFVYPDWSEMDFEIWYADIIPQMEDAHGSEKVEVDKKESSVIESQRAASIGTVISPGESAQVKMSLGGCSTKTKPIPLDERWLVVATGSWSANHSVGYPLESLSLPYAAIKENLEVANVYQFLIHRYWRGDMEIKVLVNSNKFQIGQLQASWYYCADEDAKFGDLRENVHNASQRAHGLVNAGGSNPVLLKIPYRHYLTSLYTSSETNYLSQPLTMGTLSLLVLNRLTVPSTTSNAANYTVSIRFSDSCFAGIITRSLGPQVGALDLAMKGLTCLMSDNNRDNPPSNKNPNYMVPTAAHSMCSVTGDVDILQNLRMDPRGQTPHPPGIKTDEMMISQIVRTWGFVKTLKWKQRDPNGSELLDVEMAPLCEHSFYEEITVDGTDCYHLPPVAVVSSMFSYWRGDLEYRFDVVCSQFHTGKLMAVFIPGAQSFTKGIKLAQSSPFQIYDIQESRQFVFRVPYIACRPWWPLKFNASAQWVIKEKLGIIKLYVLNPLIPNDSVSQEVDINLYVRAGENFEVSILSGMRLALSFNASIVQPPNVGHIEIELGYRPAYTTFSHLLDNKYLTLYHLNTSGAICQFLNLDETKVYIKSNDILIDGKKFVHRLGYYTSDGSSKEVKYCAAAKHASYPGVYVFDDLLRAKNYVLTGITGYCLRYHKSGEYEAYYNDSKWVPVPITAAVQWNEDSGFEIEEEYFPQIGENTGLDAPVTSLVDPVVTTQFGQLTFGENVKDLKDVCRRYSRYINSDLNFVTLGYTAVFSAKFPVTPQRLNMIINTSKDEDNRLRDGCIPIVASGYRFSRGGLRFRILFSGMKAGESIYVQFRPDAPCTSHVPLWNVASDCTSYDQLMDPSYPCLYQGFVVNSVIEFEVPWYMTGEYNLLQPVKFPIQNDNKGLIVLEFSSLGDIYLFFKSDRKKNAQSAQIYYSLADDCRFSTFVGFPPVMFLNQVKKG